MPKYKINPQKGQSFELQAPNHVEAAKQAGERRKSEPGEEVIGIEGPRGSARFYKRSKATMYPISVKSAAFLTSAPGLL